MQNIVAIAGVALLAVLCLWGAVTLANSLHSLFRDQVTYDRQLGMVRKEDHPRLFYTHAMTLTLLLLCCLAIMAFLMSSIW
jgi:hypothetical protein